MSVRQVKFWYWLVSKLPKKLMYFAFMHIGVYATTGKYGNTIVPELSMMDAIARYEKDNEIR